MSDLYDADILECSERQAALLRRVAAGERVRDTDMDWHDIAAEIESVGRSELRAVESHLIRALLDDLKCAAWPLAADVSPLAGPIGGPHWRAEARGQRADARRAFVPSMRQKIDVADPYRDAPRRMPETIDELPPMPVPTSVPGHVGRAAGERSLRHGSGPPPGADRATRKILPVSARRDNPKDAR